jgi:protease-4
MGSPVRAILVILAVGLPPVAPAASTPPVAGREPAKAAHGLFSMARFGEIGVIEVSGGIDDSRWINFQIHKMDRNPLVKALVLRIDSPGGEVGPVQEIVDEIKKFKESDKGPRPVVASFGGVAASGGYYIACAADRIISNPGALTGSIGVIMEFPVAEELLKKVGIKYVVVKSGKFKDTGNFARAMSADELAQVQNTVDDVYQQFLDVVWTGRRLALRDAVARRTGRAVKKVKDHEAMSALRAVADGRVLSGRQALEAGLVDELGNFEDAREEAARLAGLPVRAPIITSRPPRRSGWLDLLGSWLHLPEPLSSMGRPNRVSLEYMLR